MARVLSTVIVALLLAGQLLAQTATLTQRGVINSTLKYGQLAGAGSDFAPPPYAVKLGPMLATPLAGEKLVVLGRVDLIECGVSNPTYRYLAFGSSDHNNSESGLQLLCSQSDTPGSWVFVQDVAAEWTADGFTVPAPISGKPRTVTVAGYPGGSDDGEFFHAVPAKGGGIVAFGHTSGLTGVSGPVSRQTQWRMTSTAAQPLVFTYQNHIDNQQVGGAHTGSYSTTLRDGGTLTAIALSNDVFPLRTTIMRSVDDGAHWSFDPEGFNRRYPAWYGAPTRELAGCTVARIRGQLWGFSPLRDIPSGGGNATSAQLVCYRLSEDLKRPLGSPFLLLDRGDQPAVIDDSVDAGQNIPLVYQHPTKADTLNIIYNARGTTTTSGDTVNPAYAELRFDGAQSPPVAPTPTGSYASLASKIGRDGRLMPFGSHPRRTIADTQFGLDATLPAEWETVITGSSTITQREYDATSGTPGALLMNASASSGDHCLLCFGKQFYPNSLSELWVHIDGLKFDDEGIGVQFGFFEKTSATTFRPALQLFDRDAGGSAEVRAFSDGAVRTDVPIVTADSQPSWTMLQDERWRNEHSVSIALLRDHPSDGAADVWWFVVFQSGEVVWAEDVTSTFGRSNLIQPCFRVFEQDNTAHTVEVKRIRIEMSGAL